MTNRGYFNEPRSVIVYQVRHLRDDIHNHVGKTFGIEKYGFVSSIVERVKKEMNIKKRGFERRIDAIIERINKIQRQF